MMLQNDASSSGLVHSSNQGKAKSIHCQDFGEEAQAFHVFLVFRDIKKKKKTKIPTASTNTFSLIHLDLVEIVWLHVQSGHVVVVECCCWTILLWNEESDLYAKLIH